MLMLYTPNGGWRPVADKDEDLVRHWLAKFRNLRWQLRIVPLA